MDDVKPAGAEVSDQLHKRPGVLEWRDGRGDLDQFNRYPVLRGPIVRDQRARAAHCRHIVALLLEIEDLVPQVNLDTNVHVNYMHYFYHGFLNFISYINNNEVSRI